jgi:hypothetical protein
MWSRRGCWPNWHWSIFQFKNFGEIECLLAVGNQDAECYIFLHN